MLRNGKEWERRELQHILQHRIKKKKLLYYIDQFVESFDIESFNTAQWSFYLPQILQFNYINKRKEAMIISEENIVGDYFNRKD